MFKAYYNDGAYNVYLENMCEPGVGIQMGFDTGAVCTVISMEALSGKQIDKEKFIDAIRDRTAERKFKSVTGNEMVGYLVRAEDVVMSEQVILVFYYYLIVDIDDSIALLGDDFLSCCDFSHKMKDDIIVEGFHQSEYEEKYRMGIGNGELNRLMEIYALD